MIYQNDIVKIRPFTIEDMNETYFSWFYNKEVTKYNSHGLFPYTKAQQEAFKKDLENPTNRLVWAIEAFVKVNHSFFGQLPEAQDHLVFIGNAALQSINWVNRSAEFAIVIGDPMFWRKGIASHVLAFILNHAFLKLNLNRVWTGTVEWNEGMQHVCRKNGMTKEGLFRSGVFLNGQFVDVYVYSILKNDKRIPGWYEEIL